MSGARLLCICFLWMCMLECEGITNSEYQKNLIGEEERRGVNLKKELQDNDQKKSETKRGLWIIGQPNKQHYPSGYDSSGLGEEYQGYVGTTGYQSGSTGFGHTGTGYTYDSSGAGGYTKGPTFGTGFGYSASGGISNHYGHSGANLEHSGSGHEVTNQGHDIYKKLALKKILIPLAGLALLGAAAAWSSNPVLLQLGSISGRRKRRRRSILEASHDLYPANPIVRPDTSN